MPSSPRALAAESLVVTRERKGDDVTDDMRPAIVSLDVIGPRRGAEGHGPGACVVAELATQPRGVRPAELLAALAPGRGREGHVRQDLSNGSSATAPAGSLCRWGSRWDATDAPHAETRAS